LEVLGNLYPTISKLEVLFSVDEDLENDDKM